VLNEKIQEDRRQSVLLLFGGQPGMTMQSLPRLRGPPAVSLQLSCLLLFGGQPGMTMQSLPRLRGPPAVSLQLSCLLLFGGQPGMQRGSLGLEVRQQSVCSLAVYCCSAVARDAESPSDMFASCQLQPRLLLQLGVPRRAVRPREPHQASRGVSARGRHSDWRLSFCKCRLRLGSGGCGARHSG
jgi:hypothetical protein